MVSGRGIRLPSAILALSAREPSENQRSSVERISDQYKVLEKRPSLCFHSLPTLALHDFVILLLASIVNSVITEQCKFKDTVMDIL